MENRISYLDRTYDEYRNSLIDVSRKYYSNLFGDANDASIGSWLIELVSDVGDNLSYAIDRAYQETSIESAQQTDSVLNIAKTSGLKIPTRKSAVVEIELSCVLPMNNYAVSGSSNNLSIADESYAPLIKRGSLFSNGSVFFELMEDVDFKKQFDGNGFSNRQIIPNRDANGRIVSYTYKKLGYAVAGKSKIYKTTISQSDIKPFMEITIKDTDLLNIESVIVKQGNSLSQDPSLNEFYVDRESYEDKTGKPVQRFFEVANLIEQYRFGYEDELLVEDGVNQYYQPIWDVVDSIDVGGEQEPIRIAMRGKWKRLKNKFTTEIVDSSTIKLIFGAGIRNQYGNIPSNAKGYVQYLMSRMEANDYLGVLPEPKTTMYVLYRVGGGEASNIQANTLTTITYLNANIDGNCSDVLNNRKVVSVRNSLKVTNPSQSYGGRDMLTVDELRHLIKYNSAMQNRCVTVKDYYAKIFEIPPQYGIPFRFTVTEENNKIIVYTLGLDYLGKLSSPLSETVGNNIKEYLKNYKMVNDFVEIRSGRIVNVGFEVDIFVYNSYDKSEVSKRVIDLIVDYMDVRKHQMGEDIFLGDLEKEISKLDGVQNLIELRCYNNVGDGYSDTPITQSLITNNECYSANLDNLEDAGNLIDLRLSDKVLYGELGVMYEIKYPNNDVVVNVKTR